MSVSSVARHVSLLVQCICSLVDNGQGNTRPGRDTERTPRDAPLFLLPSFTYSRSGLSLKSQASTKEPTTAANRTQSQCESHVASHRTWNILHNPTRDANKTFGNHKCTRRAPASGCRSQKAAPLSASDSLTSHCSQLCPLPV